jgi:predicted HTH domain antitoxin
MGRILWTRSRLIKLLEKPLRQISLTSMAKLLGLKKSSLSNILMCRRKLDVKYAMELFRNFEFTRGEMAEILLFTLSKGQKELAHKLNDTSLSDDWYALKLFYDFEV